MERTITRILDKYGRIAIPKEVQKAAKLKAGDIVQFISNEDGSIVLKSEGCCDEFKTWLNILLKAFYEKYKIMSMVLDRYGNIKASLVTGSIKMVPIAEDIKKLIITSQKYIRSAEEKRIFYLISGEKDSVIDACIPIFQKQKVAALLLVFGKEDEEFNKEKEFVSEMIADIITKLMEDQEIRKK